MQQGQGSGFFDPSIGGTGDDGHGTKVIQFQTSSPGGVGGPKNAKNLSIALSYGIQGLATTLRPSATSGEFVVSEFIPSHFADQPHMRNFITSSAETFSKGRIEYHVSGPLSSEKLSQLSRSYRAVLLDLVQSLEGSQHLDSAMVYTHLDFVWHFCEIMFVSSHPDLPILPYLMSWVQQNFDISPEILAELGPQLPNLIPESNSGTPFALRQDSINENLQKVWDIIYLHTFHGRTGDAMKLLPYTNTTKSKVYEEQIALMQELMRKKPAYTPLSISVTEFESAWHLWRDECENRMNQKAFHGSDQLVFLAKVLCGDADGFREAREYIKTWYEYLIMMLNYQYPTARPTVLKGLARKAIEDYGDGCIQLKPIEEVILAAMEFDIVAVLKENLEHFQHPWFVLHFSDLIYCGGILPGLGETNIDYQSVLMIRDDMLLEYGTSLMQHASLWEVGIKYLAAVSDRHGWPVIAQLLRKRKPTTQYEAEKLIKIATDFGFVEEVQGICKEVAIQALHHGRLQQALLWSIRSSDIPLTTNIVDKILADDDEILNISPILTIYLQKLYTCGERLLFLKGFSEFRHSLNRKEYGHAIVQLCRLIHDQLIPKRMASKVLAHLHEFAEVGFKFRPEEVSTLTEYIHTKIGRDLLGPEEFVNLNRVLIMNRAHCLLTAFRQVRGEKETSKNMLVALNKQSGM